MKITARLTVSAGIYVLLLLTIYLQGTGRTGAAWVPAILGVLLIMYRTQMPKRTHATVVPGKEPETDYSDNQLIGKGN